MGLFSGPKQLPTNKYGYTPPPGATARGWRCSNDWDCNLDGEPAPRRWPMRCPKCGSQADPVLNEPWATESEGDRLRWMIADDGDKYGYSAAALYSWQFGQALRWSDSVKARAILAEAVAWADRFTAGTESYGAVAHNPQGSMYFEAMAYGEVALAAELLHSELARIGDYEAIDFSRIDDSDQGAMRGKYIGFVDRATKLLEHTEAKALPQAKDIDRAARYIGSATQHAMGALPVKFQWQTLMRATPLG